MFAIYGVGSLVIRVKWSISGIPSLVFLGLYIEF